MQFHCNSELLSPRKLLRKSLRRYKQNATWAMVRDYPLGDFAKSWDGESFSSAMLGSKSQWFIPYLWETATKSCLGSVKVMSTVLVSSNMISSCNTCPAEEQDLFAYGESLTSGQLIRALSRQLEVYDFYNCFTAQWLYL